MPRKRKNEKKFQSISNFNINEFNFIALKMYFLTSNKSNIEYVKLILQSEEFKVVITFVLFCCAFFCTFISSALVHDKLPDRKIYKPLPDAILDRVESYDFLLSIAEIQIIIIVSVCSILVFFHKFR